MSRIAKLGIFALAALATGLLLPLLQPAIATVYWTLTATVRLAIDLVGMAVIGLILAGLLIPLEALGWWAGWYGDPLEQTQKNLGSLQASMAEARSQAAPADTASRYIIYLDGIGQSQFTYLADAEGFLEGLSQVLPARMRIIRGLMPYSPMNRELTSDDRPFSRFWRWIEQQQTANPAGLFGFFINIRNMFVVSVSADRRYGPIYNRGTAQVIYNSLLNHGYLPGSGIPITLIGFSGGGQISMGAAPFLKDALQAPIDIISIAGVFSGNNNSLKLEHFYHMVGDKDTVERAGPLLFPGRWKLMLLSYWNRTKRKGKVTLIDLGPVGHQVPGGVMDASQKLPDGRTHLQQTIDWVAKILTGDVAETQRTPPRQLGNYDRYCEAPFNCPQFYPLSVRPPADRYCPIAPWMGRLILPEKADRRPQSVLLELHHAPAAYAHWVGQVVTLRWSQQPAVQTFLKTVTKDVHFSPEAEYHSQQGGVYPTRINHWQLVDPLESLAAGHPVDDVIVALSDPVQAERDENRLTLAIAREPMMITGRYYGLVQFVQAIDHPDAPQKFRVVHFNKATRAFDGVSEVVWMPQVVADDNGTFPFTNRGIEQSPQNAAGWYIYGAPNANDIFVVQAIAPRALFQLQPDREIVGRSAVKTYLKQTAWDHLSAQKGQISSVSLSHQTQPRQDWQVGERLLLVHVYGGIGGQEIEPAAQGPVYFGHFAFGIATIVHDPLSDELRFEIVYHQIYTQNADGLLSGTQHWSRYMGDRQFGWIGIRPIADTLIRFDPFTGNYQTAGGETRSPLDALVRQLELMAARYRIGDGTGGTYVGPANNCSQDSNQSLYAALKLMQRSVPPEVEVKAWLRQHPDTADRLKQLGRLSKDLKHHLLPWGSARADWENDLQSLGSSLEDDPIKTIARGLVSWRTMLPRVASDSITEAFLRQGAIAWMLRTNQLGGDNPRIEPIAPLTF